MSDMPMHGRATEVAGTKGDATIAIFLWIVVVCALAYGLVNTFTKVVDLFAG